MLRNNEQFGKKKKKKKSEFGAGPEYSEEALGRGVDLDKNQGFLIPK